MSNEDEPIRPHRPPYPDFALPDPLLGHVLNPRTTLGYRINALGFRGPEIGEKAFDERRIVCLGDSIPFGWFVLDEEAPFPASLQRLLDARRPGRFRVINAGVPGYASLQVLLMVRERLAALSPDLVVLCVGWNDVDFSYARDWHPEISLERLPATRVGRAFGAVRREWYFWQGFLLRWVRRTAEGRRPDPRAIGAFERNLHRIADLLRARGVPLLVTNLPTILCPTGMTDAERGRARLHPEAGNVALFQAALDRFGERIDVVYADDIFPLREARKHRYFLDHCHPNADGHAEIARRVLERILSDRRLVSFVGEP